MVSTFNRILLIHISTPIFQTCVVLRTMSMKVNMQSENDGITERQKDLKGDKDFAIEEVESPPNTENQQSNSDGQKYIVSERSSAASLHVGLISGTFEGPEKHFLVCVGQLDDSVDEVGIPKNFESRGRISVSSLSTNHDLYGVMLGFVSAE